MHRHMTVVLLAGVVGAALRSTYAHAMAGNTGDLFGPRGQPRKRLIRKRARQESQGLIQPMNPGNAGGGKEPWFGVRLNEPRCGGLA
jgi:hypothetical protein